jgi:hypothetical protein
VLELETVLGKITDDEKKLQEAVLAKKVKAPKGKVGRPKGSKNKAKVKGAGFSGGAFTPNEALYEELRRVSADPSTSANFADVIRYLVRNISEIKGAFDRGSLSQDELESAIDDLESGIADNYDDFNPDDLTDEEDTMIDEIFEAVRDWNKPVEPAPAPKTAPRRQIPLFSGNEFIISTLSKINTLLTKLIAEYNSKILVNYKNYLVTDIEEIGLKVIDSKRRFDELKTYIEAYEAGTKVADISKFLSVIERKFRDFLSLSARSIANFVNPNLVLLPNFSQELGATYNKRNLELTNIPPKKERRRIRLKEKPVLKPSASLAGFPLKRTEFERLYAQSNDDFNEYREEFADLSSRKRSAKQEARLEQLDTIILPKLVSKLDALRASPQYKKYFG